MPRAKAASPKSPTVIPYDKALPEVPGRSPYTRPQAYLEKLGEGDYAVRQGRRPSNLLLVEKLRAAVDAWRDRDYTQPDISDTTRRLFQFWFDEDHPQADGGVFRYWWAQREAIETLIFLVESHGYADLAPVINTYGQSPKLGMLDMPFTIETGTDGQRRLRV